MTLNVMKFNNAFFLGKQVSLKLGNMLKEKLQTSDIEFHSQSRVWNIGFRFLLI